MHNELSQRLRAIPTSTLATVLRQKGLHHIWMEGPRPLSPSQPRIAGPALTVRFVPAREDITTATSLNGPASLRAAIDCAEAGYVLVASTGGVRHAGVVGDILAARLASRGVAALVTEGVVRDAEAVSTSGLAVWSEGAAAPPSVAGLHFCEAGVTIGCGGVCVEPGDFIVADQDGAVVVPAALVEQTLAEAETKERFEAWVLNKVRHGEALAGLYPPSEATKVRYANEAGGGVQ